MAPPHALLSPRRPRARVARAPSPPPAPPCRCPLPRSPSPLPAGHGRLDRRAPTLPPQQAHRPERRGPAACALRRGAAAHVARKLLDRQRLVGVGDAGVAALEQRNVLDAAPLGQLARRAHLLAHAHEAAVVEEAWRARTPALATPDVRGAFATGGPLILSCFVHACAAGKPPAAPGRSMCATRAANCLRCTTGPTHADHFFPAQHEVVAWTAGQAVVCARGSPA
jgi:hypothetical protein